MPSPVPSAGLPSEVAHCGLLGRLSRITTPGRNFIPQIDGLRFIAIMAVIAYHVCSTCAFHFGFTDPNSPPTDLVSTVFRVGHLGVQLFFAVSGFILTLPFARHWLQAGPGVSLRDYYIRRVSRIEPPYIIHLIFLCVLTSLVLRRVPTHTHLYQNPDWAQYAFMHLFSSLFYSHGFVFGVHPYPNVVLWSLEVEVQFYILAPLLARLFQIRANGLRRMILVGLVLGGSLVNAVAGKNYLVQFSLAGNLQYFLIGFLLADLYLTSPPSTGLRFWGWDCAFVGAAVGVLLVDQTKLLPYLLPWLVLLGCLGAFRGAQSARFLCNSWIITIGGMCYTIYMYHWLLISLLLRAIGKLRSHLTWLDMLLQFTLLTVGILVICAVLFAVFERPFMRRSWPGALAGKLRSMLPAR